MKHLHLFPNSLRRLRERAGLWQQDVADRLGFSSTGWISRWEQGQTIPSLENIFKLAALYGVTPQDMYPELWQKTNEQMVNSVKQHREKFESSTLSSSFCRKRQMLQPTKNGPVGPPSSS